MNKKFYKYTDKEIKEILKTLVIIQDTRENRADHITSYFDSKNIEYRKQKLEWGDYSCMLPANVKFGILRDTYINSFVERKNSADEIIGNLQKSTQAAFIDELRRAQESDFVLFVEQSDFDERIASGNYRSSYDPKALKGRLETLKARYEFEIIPMSKEMIAHNIFWRLYYRTMYYLKSGHI